MKNLTFAISLAVAAAAQAITLLSPADGSVVSLLSEKQSAFVKMSREERAQFFDDGQPAKEKEIKRYGSNPQPVALKWTGKGGPYEVTVTKRGDDRPWFKATVVSDGVEVWNLEIAATYDWKVVGGGECATGRFTTEDLPPRLLRIPGVPNVRDLGGRKIGGRRVKQGMVYRSSGLNNNAKTVYYSVAELQSLEADGKLAGMGELGAKYSAMLKAGEKLDKGGVRLIKSYPTAPGTARLSETWRAYMVNDLGIRTDLDLRSTRERFGMVGSPLGPYVKFVTMVENFHGYSAVHSSGAEDVRRVLRVFLDRANYPIDFHCIGGADRTGTVATILHGILGLDEDEIWKDYQITAWYGTVNDAKHLNRFSDLVKSFDRFEGATLSERICKFVLKLGFTEEDLQKIRDIMLEPEEASAADDDAEKREVKVSSFGFYPADSTEFLQKALDSGAARVVVDLQSGPWVTRPLRIRRQNLELVFEPGVELVAKKGEFRDVGDSLINAGRGIGLKIIGNGATLRMHRADYMKKPYARGEWRHALVFTNAKDVLVENLRIVDSGGDAIYLGGSPRGACENVTIRDVTAIGNLRQGISVISAENLLVENCVFENTCGLPPMDGIDFEPNGPGQRIANCIVRNCVSRGNHGAGWDVAVFKLNSSSRPLSVLFDGCMEADNSVSLRVWCENRDFDCVRGKVEFRNCSFARPKGTAFSFAQNPDFPVSIDFQNCRYVPKNGAASGDVPDWKAINVAPSMSGSGANLTVKAVANPDFKRAVVLDSAPGEMVELSKFNLRFHCRYLFYADRARTVRFRGRQVRIGNGKIPRSDAPIEITALDGRAVAKMDMPGFDEAEFSVEVPAAGFYSFYSRCQPSPFVLTASDAPVALDCAPGRVPVINSSGRLYFRTAAGGRPFAFTACGSDSEMVHARIFAPNGETVWDQDSVSRSFRHVVADPQEGLWTVLLSKPSKGKFEDYKFDLTGIPGHLFLCKEKTWCIPAP